MATESHIEPEEWRPVVGWEDRYEVSSRGCLRQRGGRLLKPRPRKDGYRTARLCPRRGKYQHGIHQLVCEAFYGPAPAGHEPRHLNGVAGDDRVSNLRWGTHAENEADKLAHGTAQRGSGNSQAKLSEEAAAFIKALPRDISHTMIADVLEMSLEGVMDVRRGRRWPHVEPAGEAAALRWLKTEIARQRNRVPGDPSNPSNGGARWGELVELY